MMLHLCRCIQTIINKDGLESYFNNNFYFCKYKKADKKGESYYQVYPDTFNLDHYEIFKIDPFKKSFKIIETLSSIKKEESIIEWLNRIESKCPIISSIYNDIAQKILIDYIDFH